ncbi:MAG: hypothetical protein ACRYFU_21260 [Janthinobacterium lividum]
MAGKTKYDGILKRTEPAQSELIEETSPAPEAAPMPPAARRPGRPTKPLAKSKDPNMKGYTLILNIDTHADASSILKKLRTGEDMSELAERLLAGWVKENK